MGHPGPIINSSLKQFDYTTTVKKARAEEMKIKRNQK